MTNGIRGAALAGLTALALAGCGGGGSSNGTGLTTGVRGLVVNGNPATARQPRPGAVVHVYALGAPFGPFPNSGRTETKVADVTANAQGVFQIALPPGDYLFAADLPPGTPATSFNMVQDPDDVCSIPAQGTVAANQVLTVKVGSDLCANLPVD